VSCITQKTTKI